MTRAAISPAAKEMMNSEQSNLEELEFICCGLAIGASSEAQRAVSAQLTKWWKGGVQSLNEPSALPLHLSKEIRPILKEVALFEIEGSGAVLIESNLRDNYLSLLSMVSKSLPEVNFVSIRSCPVGRCAFPIEDFGIFRNGSGTYVRHVWVALDGKRWRFEQTGELQPYETAADYRRRNISERLTRGHILKYLAALRIPLESVAKGVGVQHIESFREQAAAE